MVMGAAFAWLTLLGAVLVAGGCSWQQTSVPGDRAVTELQATQTSTPLPATPMPLRGPAHPDRATIIDGSWLIGADFPPALYMTPTPVTRCHWRVSDYATGAMIEEGDYSGAGPTAIWVGDGDLFQSEGCFLWQGFPQLTGERAAPSDSSVTPDASAAVLGDGRWRIGPDAAPGQYRSDRSNTGACAFEVDRSEAGQDESFRSSGTRRSIPAYLDLTLKAGDLFTTQGCGEWLQRKQ